MILITFIATLVCKPFYNKSDSNAREDKLYTSRVKDGLNKHVVTQNRILWSYKLQVFFLKTNKSENIYKRYTELISLMLKVLMLAREDKLFISRVKDGSEKPLYQRLQTIVEDMV